MRIGDGNINVAIQVEVALNHGHRATSHRCLRANVSSVPVVRENRDIVLHVVGADQIVEAIVVDVRGNHGRRSVANVSQCANAERVLLR